MFGELARKLTTIARARNQSRRYQIDEFGSEKKKKKIGASASHAINQTNFGCFAAVPPNLFVKMLV